MNNDYLYHFGIPGMKWGIRRFQDGAGRLTEAGKARYGKSDSDSKDRVSKKELRQEQKAQRDARKEERRAQKKANTPESKNWRSREAKYLDDAELQRRITRLQREKQYAEMTQTRGQKFMKGFGKAANKILIASLIGAASGFMAANYKTMISTGAEIVDAYMNAPLPIDYMLVKG